MPAAAPTAGVWTRYPTIDDAFRWAALVGLIALAVVAVIAGRSRPAPLQAGHDAQPA